MEYQFKTDLYQQPQAQLSMGHEAFGCWLSETLADAGRVDALLLKLKSGIEFEQVDQEFQLLVSRDEVEVRAIALGLEPCEPLPEDTELFDAQQFASCGLADFVDLLEGWRDFLQV